MSWPADRGLYFYCERQMWCAAELLWDWWRLNSDVYMEVGCCQEEWEELRAEQERYALGLGLAERVR